MQDQVLGFARKLFKGRIQIESVRGGGDAHGALQISRTGAGAQASFEKRLGPVHDHFGGIEIIFRTEAVAFGASAVRRIETEGARFELRNGNAAIRAGQFLGVYVFITADDGDGYQASGKFQRVFDGLFQALRDAVFQQQAVHDDLDGVILAAVERNRFVQIDEVAIHAGAHVAGLREFFEFLFVFAFAAADHRREDHDAIVRLQRENGLDNLLGGLPGDGLAAIGAMRRADGAIDDAQIIVNLGDGADRRARRTRGGFLFDGDGRRKPLDGVHFGPLHLIEKLARVGGKRFHVTALAFGVERIERERGFAGAGEAGNDRKGIAGDFQVDIFEVVLPGAPDNDFFQSHFEKERPLPSPGYKHERTVAKMRPR